MKKRKSAGYAEKEHEMSKRARSGTNAGIRRQPVKQWEEKAGALHTGRSSGEEHQGLRKWEGISRA